MSNRLEYWKNCWEADSAFWHKSAVNCYLLNHHEKISKGAKGRIFVPLCGKSLDLKWLYDMGHEVVGVDGAEKPVLEFFNEHGLKYRNEVQGNIKCYLSEDERLRVYVCDLFEIDHQLLGKFSGIWDRGSLVAIYHEDRPRYVELIKQIFSANCSYLIDTMVYDQSKFPGPPRSVSPEEIEKLFGDKCNIEHLETIDRNIDPNSPDSPNVKWGIDICHEVILLLTSKTTL